MAHPSTERVWLTLPQEPQPLHTQGALPWPAAFWDMHEAPQPSLEMVTLEKPDTQASLAQPLPADPTQGSGQSA